MILQTRVSNLKKVNANIFHKCHEMRWVALHNHKIIEFCNLLEWNISVYKNILNLLGNSVL